MFGLGQFHASMAFLTVLGKRFEECGQRDVLVQSSVAIEGWVNGVLHCIFYNRTVRCDTLIVGSCCRSQWLKHIDHLSAEEQERDFQFAAKPNYGFPCLYEKFVASQEEKVFGFFHVKSPGVITPPRIQTTPSGAPMLTWCSLLLFLPEIRQGNFNLHIVDIPAVFPWFLHMVDESALAFFPSTGLK